jgi:magnesium chelatase accessory protein
MWLETIRALSNTYRCVALDLPGHGESSKPPIEWYSLAHFREVVAQAIRLMGLDRPVLVGHSMGGTIVLDMAALRPAPMRAVVALNPVVTGRVAVAGPIPSRVAKPVAALTRKVWPMATRLLRGAPDLVGRASPAAWRRIRQDFGRTSADAAVGSVRAVIRADLASDLQRVEIPTLVVVGRRDRAVPPAEGRLAARLVPDARLVEFDCGHHPHDESRKEFLAALNEFLASMTGP